MTVAECSSARPELLQTFSIKDAGFKHLKDFVLVEHKVRVGTSTLWAQDANWSWSRSTTNSSLPIAISLYNPVVDSWPASVERV